MWDNPVAWVGLCLIVALVIGINLALIGAIRGRGDRSGIGRVLSGLDQARRQRQADEARYAELARLVDELKQRDGGGSSETHGE